MIIYKALYKSLQIILSITMYNKNLKMIIIALYAMMLIVDLADV